MIALVLVFYLSGITQMRGVWVCSDDLISKEGIDKVLTNCAEMGITDVFLQVRTAGDASYYSDTEPRSHKLQDQKLDVLAYSCNRGHELDLKIHAWINVNYCAPGPGLPSSANHVAREHPEWIAKGRDGRSMTLYTKAEFRRLDSEGLYLSPDEAGVSEYFAGVVNEILRKYPVDGIHLDFIRFANYRFGYNGELAESYLDRYHIDPSVFAYEELNAPSNATQDMATLWRKIMQLRWLTMRADAISGLVGSIRSAQIRTRPGAVLTAAVWFPATHAYGYVGQDWMRWLDEDLVDTVIPMAYSKQDKPIAAFMPRVKRYVEDGRIVMGLGSWRLDAESTTGKIALVEEQQGGWVLFDYGGVARSEEYLETVGCFVKNHYINNMENLENGNESWQQSWVTRRTAIPLDYSLKRISELNSQLHESRDKEAICLLDTAVRAWGSSRMLPDVNKMSTVILPLVDDISLELARCVTYDEGKLREYFYKHHREYLKLKGKIKHNRKLSGVEMEELYRNNRSKVYHDIMMDNMTKAINDLTKRK